MKLDKKKAATRNEWHHKKSPARERAGRGQRTMTVSNGLYALLRLSLSTAEGSRFT